MTKDYEAIPCEVCRDLAPLVADGVASEQSAALVRAHLAACPACAAEWPGLAADSSAPPPPPEPDDARVLRRLHRRLTNRTALLLAVGTVGGTLLTYSRYSLLSILFFPLVCGVLSWQRDPAWRLLLLLTFAASALVNLAASLAFHSYLNWQAAAVNSLVIGAAAAGLCLLGALAGHWLAYAFKKEEKEE